MLVLRLTSYCIQFCFHVARSGCSQSDYRMVPCHRHVCSKKFAIVIWRSLIARFWIRNMFECAWSFGKVESSAVHTQIIMQAWKALSCECPTVVYQNWIYVSPDSFLCVLDTDYAHILCLLAFSVCNIHGWTKRSIKKNFFLVQGVQKLVAERWTIAGESARSQLEVFLLIFSFAQSISLFFFRPIYFSSLTCQLAYTAGYQQFVYQRLGNQNRLPLVLPRGRVVFQL